MHIVTLLCIAKCLIKWKEQFQIINIPYRNAVLNKSHPILTATKKSTFNSKSN